MALAPSMIEQLLLESGGSFAVHSIEQAQDFCARLAADHYENFPVASLLLHRQHRRHITAIYAFARLADDVADEEIVSGERAEERLEWMIDSVCSVRHSTNPVIVATRAAMQRYDLPSSLLGRLIAAFKHDARFVQPRTWEDIHAYCHNSADPVGEIVLRIHGEDSLQNIRHSDSICTALQLINFWQDQSRDHVKGRCFIPAEDLQRYGCMFSDGRVIASVNAPADALATMFASLYVRTRMEMVRGLPLLRNVRDIRLRIELCLICASAMHVLSACENVGNRIQDVRPSLRKRDMVSVAVRALRYAFTRHPHTA